MRTRWRLVLCLGVVGAIGFIVGVLTTPPAASYEVSVYDAYEPWTWAGFALALVAGLGAVFRTVLSDEYGCLSGIALVASVYVVFFAIPLFRGYYIYGTPMSDSLYHFGIVRDVLGGRTIPETAYPATHLLYTALVSVTGLPMRELQPLVAFAFFALFVGSFFLVGRAFFGRRGGVATMGAALPLVFVSHQLQTLPWLFALPFLPILLALTHRWATRRNAAHEGVFGTILICGSILVFYHPVTALVTVLALVLYAAVVAAPSLRGSLLYRDRPQSEAGDQRTYAVPYRLPLIILIPGVFWYLSIGHITHFLSRIVTRDVGGGAAEYAGAAQQTSYTAWELVWEFLVLKWGTVLLYAGVGAVIAAAVLIRTLRRRGNRLELLFALQFGAGVSVAIVLMGLQVLSRNVVRLNNYTLVAAMLLIGLAFTGLVAYRSELDGGWKRTGATIALCGLCLTVLTTALLAGAIAYEDNRHVTHATVAGAEWQHEYHQSGTNTRAFRMSENIQRYLEGVSQSTPDDRQFHRSLEAHQVPNRLGYDAHDSMADTYENETYVVTKMSDIKWAADQPPDRRDEIRHYTAADLERATTDPTANRVYDNGALNVWYVNPNEANQ